MLGVKYFIIGMFITLRAETTETATSDSGFDILIDTMPLVAETNLGMISTLERSKTWHLIVAKLPIKAVHNCPTIKLFPNTVTVLPTYEKAELRKVMLYTDVHMMGLPELSVASNYLKFDKNSPPSITDEQVN